MLPGFTSCTACAETGERIQCGLCNEVHRTVPPYIGCYQQRRPCPSCSGVGSVPADATVQAIAKAIASEFAEDVDESHHDGARAALVAYAQTVKEN